MEFAFYICGLIAILATLRVVTHTNPVHALLYTDYFAAGDCRGVLFAGRLLCWCAGNHRLRRGHYGAGFVFVVMMLNLGGSEIEQERKWLQPGIWIGPAILSAVLLVVIVYAILGINDRVSTARRSTPKKWVLRCLGRTSWRWSLASMLLLAGLVVAFHIGREERAGEVLSNRVNDSDKRKRRNTRDP